jgi:hypothetical protein
VLTYATPADLTAGATPWLIGPAPTVDLGVMCRWGTIAVAHACQLDLYGPAPDTATAAVLNDATCAQIASWVALGVDPAKAGTDMPGPVRSSTILAATVARDTTAAARMAVDAVTGLCDLASDLLQTAGLLWVPVPLGVNRGDMLPQWGQGRPVWLYADALSGEPEWPYGPGINGIPE